LIFVHSTDPYPILLFVVDLLRMNNNPISHPQKSKESNDVYLSTRLTLAPKQTASKAITRLMRQAALDNAHNKNDVSKQNMIVGLTQGL